MVEPKILIDRRAHERLDALDKALIMLRDNQSDMLVKLEANTELTKTIEKNTADAVDLLKGGKVLGRFITWTTSLTALYYIISDHFKT